MHEKEGMVELTDSEARLANYRPRFPLGEVSSAISHMRRRQNELQQTASDAYPSFDGTGHMEPISRYGFMLGELIDRLEKLR